MSSKQSITSSGSGKSGAHSKYGHGLLKDFLFAPNFVNLNHGSFGTIVKPVRAAFRQYQDEVEARPDPFILYIYPEQLDKSRAAIAKLLNVPVSEIVFVPNATTGINTVLRNLSFESGDVIIYFASIYGACEKTINYVTETTPAESERIDFVYPVEDDWLVSEFQKTIRELRSQGKNPKLALFDTVVSMPGVRMPFERLTEVCRDEGVLSCIDGAHAVGMLGSELDLSRLRPDFFVSNCHKWLYVPRGCAVFYVPTRNQPLIRSTLPTSHGFTPKPKPGAILPKSPFHPSTNSPFVTNFEFVGTMDNAPYLCVPTAIEYRNDVLGGEDAIKEYCFALARRAGRVVSDMLGTEVLDNKQGTLGNCCFANVRLPLDPDRLLQIASAKSHGTFTGGNDNLAAVVRLWCLLTLVREYDTFIPVMWYKEGWWVRLSAQVYLEIGDFERASRVLGELCERVVRGEFLTVEEKSKL